MRDGTVPPLNRYRVVVLQVARTTSGRVAARAP